MTAHRPASAPYMPPGASQLDLWGNDSSQPAQGHTAPSMSARALKRAATAARRRRKVTRRLYVPVDDLLLEDLALVAKAQGTSIPELARVVLYRGMGLAA